MRHVKHALAAAMLVAACANTQPLTAQTTPRDSAIAKAATTVKAVTDTIALQPAPNITQFCASGFSGYGYMRNGACLTFPRLLRRAQVADSALFAALALPVLPPKPDTIRVVRVDTVRRVDTVVVAPTPAPSPTPAPVAIASVSTSLTDRTLLPGEMTTARVTVKDSAGKLVTTRPIAWSSANATVAAVSDSGAVTAVSPGTSAIRATVDGKSSYATLTVIPPADTIAPPPAPPIALDVAPELPRVSLNTAMSTTPSMGRTIVVHAGQNLQAVLDSVKAGDRVVLDACAAWTGNFLLKPAAAGIAGGWVTLTTTAAISSEGTRARPALVAPSCYSRLLSPNVLPALATTPNAQRWRLVGLEISVAAGVTANQGLVQLGDGSTAQTVASAIARNLVLDRMYIHGTPTLDMRRCVGLNSDSTAIVDSYISDCHSAGFDAQAIAGWNGNGPYKIANNYLEASTEVVSFGGADPSIPNLVPSDIEILRNHITRPMSWKGGPWLIKNLIEFKNARRARIEGNVLENSWPNGQYGWAFVLWSVNQTGGCPWCITSDVLIQNNLIRNVAAGFQLTDKYRDTPSPAMTRVAIRNNVVIGMASAQVGDGGYGFLISNTVPGLTIEHNTMFNPISPSWTFPAGAAPNHFTARNNLTGGCGPYQLSMQAAFAKIADTTSRFLGNVVACFDNYAGLLPSGNFFPASLAAVGLAGGAGAAHSVTATPDSLALSNASPYHNAGTDGKDIGADITAVKAAIAGVVQSVPLGAIRPLPIRKP